MESRVVLCTYCSTRYIQSGEACDTWLNVSYTGAYTLYEDLPGDDNVIFKNGHSFMDLIDKMASEVPEGAIKTSKRVTKIDWSKGEEVTLEVNNGKDDEIEADYVIFTGSMGFLKENYEELFEPE